MSEVRSHQNSRRGALRIACIVSSVTAVFVGVACLPVVVEAEDTQGTADLHVRVDPRVELMSIISRIAGFDEYRMGRVKGYSKAVDEHFGKFSDDPVIALVRELRSSSGIGYDACMNLAVHLDETTFALRRQVKEGDVSLDDRWNPATAGEFAEKAASFARRSHFSGFLAEKAPLFAKSVARMNEALAKEVHLEWFEEFYGARPTAAFHLVLGMLNGPGNYGVQFRSENGTEKLYCIYGVEETDDAGIPVFGKRISATVAHEFSHSFVNPAVEANRAAFKKTGEKLFAAFEAEMRKLAYGQWKTMIDESLVRAATICYLQKYSGEAAWRKQLDWEVKRNKFLWLGDLVDLLHDYQGSRDKYPTFASFLPRVVTFLDAGADGYIATIKEEREVRAKRAPKVVSVQPANGSTDVDPSMTSIIVTFDQPMRTDGYSIMYVEPQGPDHFPEFTGSPKFDRSGKVLTLPVRLKPDWTYRFALNDESGGAFKSRDGYALQRYEVQISTSAPR